MNRFKTLRLLSPILCLSILSCMNFKQTRNEIDYYTLEYETPMPKDPAPVNEIIRVFRFDVAPAYNTNQLVYRDQAYKRQTYHYHKWRANPADLVSYYLARDLTQSGLFKAVLTYDSKIPSTCLLEGTLDEFYEWDMTPSWMAALTVTVTLMAENEPDITRRVLLQKTYRAREPCEQKNPRFLAEAMSRAMARISGEIMHDIHARLKTKP